MINTDFLRSNARWLAAGSLLTFLSCFGQTFFISVFAGHIQEDFGLSHGEWGGIYTIGTSASAVVMIWAGGLTDKFRARAIGTCVLCLLAFACVFMGLNQSAALLVFVIFLLRFAGQGMLSHISLVSMSRWFVASRGTALSVAGLGFAIGEAFLPVTFITLFAVFDWRVLWIGCAALLLLSIPVLRGLLKSERTPQSIAEEVQSLGMGERFWTRGEVLKHPLFWFMIPALLGPAAFGTAFFFHQVHFASVKGWSHLELALLFPVYTVVAVGSMVVSGLLLDRFGTPRLIPWFQTPLILAFALFAFGQNLGWALVGLVIMGISNGANATLPNAFWAEFYGTKHLGSIKAMATAVMVFGSAIGPGLTGALIDLGLEIDRQYYLVALYFLFTTVMMAVGVAKYRGSIRSAITA